MKIFFLIFFQLFLVGWAWAEDVDQQVTIEDFLQKLSSVPGIMSRKDPFILMAPPFEPPKRPEAEETISRNAPVLERYPADKYTVVATLLGDQYPRALLRLPPQEQGKVLIVKEKDRLGNRDGVISKILKDGLVVIQNQKSPLGLVEKLEVVLRVGGGKVTGSPAKK